MKHERSWLVALVATSAMVLGLSEANAAGHLFPEGRSYTQPGAELVMPYDTDEGRVSFLTVSNVAGEQVSTHWVFWSETCDLEGEISICLTPNDTVIVDPRNMSEINRDNEPVGDPVSLDGVKGIVTVVAYETDEDCAPATDTPIVDDSILGSFTFADTDDGYSFGNDALALGTENGSVAVPAPEDGNDYEFIVQTFNPATVEASLVLLAHLRENAETGTVGPSNANITLATSFIDTTEIPTSLPDITVGCTEFYSITGDLIPDTTTVSTSGIIRLEPYQGLANGTDYLYGLVGQAIADIGASSSIKQEQVEGSASGAFVDGIDLF